MLVIEEPAAPPPGGFALWELGFRPFYLLASIFAALSIPLWALQFSGLLGHAYLAGPVWHAHEMLFGFALAVIVGFLFTAGRNWANQPTPTGLLLAGLVALWLAGRLLVLTPFAAWAAAVNVAFPACAAIALAVPFYKGRNRRNYFFVGLLAALAVASAVVHLSQLGIIRTPSWAGLQLGLDIVLFIVSVMAGRVVPMFTNNGVPGAQARRHPWVEKAALGSILLLIAADVLGLGGMALAAIAGAACIAHATRLALWQPWKTLRVPLVWVLQAAYLWVPIHLALRALAEIGLVAPSAATHALTVGAIGGLIIGMMTRTARGHTARPLRADGVDTACYALVLGAALVRVALPLLWPAQMLHAVQGSALLWSAGFGLFAVRYWPVLTRARLDGEEGVKMDYMAIKLIHQSAVTLSLTGFFVRGAAALAGAQWVHSRPATTLPHIVDTVLLLSALTLAWMLRLTPANAPWLLAKVVGLVVYIALGVVALRPGRSNAVRASAWLAALATAAWIVSVALTKSPLGFFGALA